MKILAISAHPDDIEIQCYGTLARFALGGDEVTFAIFTSGNMGDLHIAPAELGAMRKLEAQNAAAVIGAKVIWPAIDDECVFPNEEQRRIMIDVMREADPDLIITHSPNDYHPDHRYVSQLVFDSYYQKGLPHMPGQRLPACRFGQCPIYYMDNVGGINFSPVEYVDITSVMDIKKKMLACHISQVESMREHSNTDIMDMIETQGKFRGFAAGCKYAEAFGRLDAFLRAPHRRLLP